MFITLGMDIDAQLAQYFVACGRIWTNMPPPVAASKPWNWVMAAFRGSAAPADCRAHVDQGRRRIAGRAAGPGRVRREGGGRHALTSNDPGLAPALDAWSSPRRVATRSRPALTCKSARTLAAELTARRHPVSHTKVTQLLRRTATAAGQPQDRGRGDHLIATRSSDILTAPSTRFAAGEPSFPWTRRRRN